MVPYLEKTPCYPPTSHRFLGQEAHTTTRTSVLHSQPHDVAGERGRFFGVNTSPLRASHTFRCTSSQAYQGRNQQTQKRNYPTRQVIIY
ncbi:hypothetical protein PGB90_000084 [Kerria lacca]